MFGLNEQDQELEFILIFFKLKSPTNVYKVHFIMFLFPNKTMNMFPKKTMNLRDRLLEADQNPFYLPGNSLAANCVESGQNDKAPNRA